MSSTEVKIGLIGWGTVGSGVSRLLLERSDLLRSRTDIQLKLSKIASRNIRRPRGIEVDPSILTTDVDEILEDDQIDIVIELVGGLEPARSFILKAIENGKHVVTANKALLAQYGPEIFKAAHEKRISLGFEASVAGGIPIIKALREGLVANQVQALYGIINGTSNYILTQMSTSAMDFSEALKNAQTEGYAEADPTYDVEGLDAAHKIAILTSLAYGIPIKLEEIFVEGITKVTQNDIRYARQLGYVIKLLAISKLSDGEVEVRVHPTLLPEISMVAKINGVFNGIYVIGDAVGSTLFYGRGAGQMPTASAVVADVIDVAKSILSGSPLHIPYCFKPNCSAEIRLKNINQCRSKYYIRFTVIDKPGVLAKIAGILGEHQISIASVIQKEQFESESVPVVMMTHEAYERNIQAAIKKIDQLDVVKARSVVIREEPGE